MNTKRDYYATILITIVAVRNTLASRVYHRGEKISQSD